MNAQQLLEYVIRPALVALELHSKSAEILVLGTAIQESNLNYVKQLGGGPAQGLWQMEIATHDDIWLNFLNYKEKLSAKILSPGQQPDAERLVYDNRYACQMCRIHYLRAPARLPDANDIRALGAYWKKFYNTEKGAGTVDQFVVNWYKARS